MGENRKAYRIFIGKREGKKLVRGPGFTWVGNIKMDIRGLEWGDMD
jgi:hypothetical protein